MVRRISIILAIAIYYHLPLLFCQEKKIEILASIICPVNKEPKLFLLTRESIASPILVKKKPLSDVDHLVFFRLTRFAINENLSAVKAESLVWQESTYTLGPNLRRKYDLEYDHITSSLYLVWAALSPPKFSILAYKIDPTGSTTAKLGGFNPNGYATQPPESEREKPFDENFTKEYNISKDWCQPEGPISIVVERDSILLSATQFEERNCPPAYFRLDFHTKKWKEISYQGK